MTSQTTPTEPAGPPDLVIRARRVVTPNGIQPAAVHIRAGRISAITTSDVRTAVPGRPSSGGSGGSSPQVSTAVGRPGAADPGIPESRFSGELVETIDLEDDEVLMPGLVDTHVHVNEPGRTHWEGFATATAAAAAGGVTTLVDMPLNSIPPTTDVAALELKRLAAAGQCAVDVGFWGGAVPGNVTRRPGLHEAGVFGFKCFLVDSGVPEFPPLDDAALAAAIRQVAGLRSLLIVHAEDAARIGAPSQAGAGYAGFLASRPPDAEVSAVARVIEHARASGGRVHVLHLSSADAVPLIAAAQADGVAITAETCPHYLALAAEEVGPGQTQFKCCPPIRDQANSEALWAALAAGVIGCVVSDHSPCPPELKGIGSVSPVARAVGGFGSVSPMVGATGDFGSAWGGISSVQLGLPVIWTRARALGHDLSDVARWMALGPAALVGLVSKGAIEEGKDADLVAFAPDETFVVTPDRLLTRHRLTPYTGQELYGVVRKTWLRGSAVIPGRPAGQLIVRNDNVGPLLLP